MCRWIASVLAALVFAATAQVDAFESPPTAAHAMDDCCAPLFGKWRGKGWILQPDGRRVDVDAEIEVILAESGEAALFIMDYAPLKADEGQAVHKVALLTYWPDRWETNDPIADFKYTAYRFRYLWGGPFWGVRFRSGPFGQEWVEPYPGGGVVRYLFPNIETAWSVAGFCCTGGDEDRLVAYFLVTRVGPLGKQTDWWSWPAE